jgi:hypothetical protein
MPVYVGSRHGLRSVGTALATGASATGTVTAGAIAVVGGSVTGSPGSWSPLDLGVGLLAWYKADALSQADASAVTSWTDSSGNGWHATEATNTPTYETNELNGLPVIRFDAVDDTLNTASITHGIGTGDFSITTVVKTMAAYTDGFRTVCNISALAHAALHGDTGPNLMSGNMYMTGDHRFDVNLGISTWKTLVYTRVGTALSLFINGTQDTDVGQTSSNSILTGSIGIGKSGGSVFGSDVAEIVVYKGTLSAGDRGSLESYLRSKYAHY